MCQKKIISVTQEMKRDSYEKETMNKKLFEIFLIYKYNPFQFQLK